MDADADYFISDGQHRYCAILDFVRAYSDYVDRFTQPLTISVLPQDKLEAWAGQAFHDRNYYAVQVRAGKALAVDTRDALNSFGKSLATHSIIDASGGVAYERDTLLKNDARFTTHTVLHRFVRGFLFGRHGLDKSTAVYADIDPVGQENVRQWLRDLGDILPWNVEDRDEYLTRSSVVLSALSVIGHDVRERLAFSTYEGAA